jgi:hypothetical protein
MHITVTYRSFYIPFFKIDLHIQVIFPTSKDAGRHKGGIEIFSTGKISLNDLGALSFRTTFAHN